MNSESIARARAFLVRDGLTPLVELLDAKVAVASAMTRLRADGLSLDRESVLRAAVAALPGDPFHWRAMAEPFVDQLYAPPGALWEHR